jgi:N-methylhydantoinase A/oxoprolinase/acetone carboxylase beta subunit
MGTTVATNALLERKGERCALLITKGFKVSSMLATNHHDKAFSALQITMAKLFPPYIPPTAFSCLSSGTNRFLR